MINLVVIGRVKKRAIVLQYINNKLIIMKIKSNRTAAQVENEAIYLIIQQRVQKRRCERQINDKIELLSKAINNYYNNNSSHLSYHLSEAPSIVIKGSHKSSKIKFISWRLTYISNL